MMMSKAPHGPRLCVLCVLCVRYMPRRSLRVLRELRVRYLLRPPAAPEPLRLLRTLREVSRALSRRAKVSACRSADGPSAIDEIDDADNADEPRTECQRIFGAFFFPPALLRRNSHRECMRLPAKVRRFRRLRRGVDVERGVE